jgi:hypothetical protein
MNKKTIIIGIVSAIVISVGAIVAYGAVSSEKEEKDSVQADITPTPTDKVTEAHESVVADLTINTARTSVALELSGLGGRYSGVSYELRYASDQGEKGAVGGLRTPIPLEEGADMFSRDIELGTCSTGGKCRYDKGVNNISLTIKLHTSDNDVEVLQKKFDHL